MCKIDLDAKLCIPCLHIRAGIAYFKANLPPCAKQEAANRPQVHWCDSASVSTYGNSPGPNLSLSRITDPAALLELE